MSILCFVLVAERLFFWWERHKLWQSDAMTQVRFGRTLVTIDDLRALFDVLRSIEGNKSRTVVAQFDGGEFDAPEDLRELSDGELTRITLELPDVKVVLADTEAYVLGSPEVCELVCEHWAKGRRVRIFPESRKRLVRREFLWSSAICAVLLGLAALGGGLGAPSGGSWGALAVFLAVILLCSCGRLSFSCAVIKPMSLEEFRKQSVESARHRRTVVVALIGIAVAAIVAFVVKKWVQP